MKLSLLLLLGKLLPRDITAFNAPISPIQHLKKPRNQALFVSGDKEAWEKDLSKTKGAIDRLDALEAAIQKDDSDLANLSAQVSLVQEELARLQPLCPQGLSKEELYLGIIAYARLSLSLKLGLYLALELNTDAAPYPQAADYPEIVARLYEQRLQLTSQRIEDAVKEAQKILKSRGRNFSDPKDELFQIGSDADVDGKIESNVAKQQLGRVTRKTTVSEQNLRTFLDALNDNKKVFQLRGSPEPIPGGYLVRGTNLKPTPKELIAALDAKLPPNWECQVSYMPDVTRTGLDKEEEGPIENVLVLLNKDFEQDPFSKVVIQVGTAVALATSFIFGVNIFANNVNVASELSDKTALGDVSGFDWINGQVFEALLPLAIVQLLHELGHFLISKKDKIKISAPALIPFYDRLPNMGFRTDIKSSPPNSTSLFDFSFLGPFFGIISSLLFLVYGLQATISAGPEVVQFFPALTVAQLKMSTLGGGIVDYFLGGDGVITSQNPSSAILMHPFAVGGFVGLVIQSLEMLPLGSTDGGRISQALFGRSNHVLVGGWTWFALLLSTIFLDSGTDYIVGAWIINNVAQNDMEVPCREEVSRVDILRGFAAVSLWMVAILALVPMQ